MNIRLALYGLAATHRLDAAASARLEQLAGLSDEPSLLRRRLPVGAAVLAAALGGLGLIFWIAANWETLGRFGRFGLLQGLVLAMCLGAMWRPAARVPLALLGLLGIGGLFAYFGQTYQTGADPWQLFALWALLGLPLCLAVRSDVVWAPWALITMTGISLWVQAHTGHRWRVEPDDLRAHAIGGLGALAVTVALGSMLQRWTGAGVWAQRTALTLGVTMITATALGGLFHQPVAPHYWMGLVLLIAMVAVLAQPRSFEVFGVSAAGLGLNTLLVAGLTHLLFDRPHHGDLIGSLLIIGLVAAGLLAATVSGVLRLARRNPTVQGGSAA